MTKRNKRWTTGPWDAPRMVHEDTNEPMTPEQIGEYVKNTVIKSFNESGTYDFMIVQGYKEDGRCDICHVGNGPTSKKNAPLISVAPDLVDSCESLLEEIDALVEDGTLYREDVESNTTVQSARSALKKAYGGNHD